MKADGPGFDGAACAQTAPMQCPPKTATKAASVHWKGRVNAFISLPQEGGGRRAG